MPCQEVEAFLKGNAEEWKGFKKGSEMSRF